MGGVTKKLLVVTEEPASRGALTGCRVAPSRLAERVEPGRLMSAARLAAKQEEAASLKRMLEEVQRRQAGLEAELGAKQAEALRVAAAFEPISERLRQVEDAARQWQAALKENQVP